VPTTGGLGSAAAAEVTMVDGEGCDKVRGGVARVRLWRPPGQTIGFLSGRVFARDAVRAATHWMVLLRPGHIYAKAITIFVATASFAQEITNSLFMTRITTRVEHCTKESRGCPIRYVLMPIRKPLNNR
jgi:hypothetical protein